MIVTMKFCVWVNKISIDSYVAYTGAYIHLHIYLYEWINFFFRKMYHLKFFEMIEQLMTMMELISM